MIVYLIDDIALKKTKQMHPSFKETKYNIISFEIKRFYNKKEMLKLKKVRVVNLAGFINAFVLLFCIITFLNWNFFKIHR